MNDAPKDAPPTLSSLVRGPIARWVALSCALLMVVMVLYALSFGPAVMMAQRRLIRTETVERIYAPLETATLIVPGANWLLTRYVGFWAVEDPQP